MRFVVHIVLIASPGMVPLRVRRDVRLGILTRIGASLLLNEELIAVISRDRDLVTINSGGVDPMSLIVDIILVTRPGVVALAVRGDVGLRILLRVRAGVHLPVQTLLVRELCSGEAFRNSVLLVGRG